MPPPAAVGERAEDRRHQRVDADADRDRDATAGRCRRARRTGRSRYSPIAPDTTAKLKIVFAKSYSDQAAGTTARPLGVRPARPPGAGRGTARRGGGGHGRDDTRRRAGYDAARWTVPTTARSGSHDAPAAGVRRRSAPIDIRDPVVEPVWPGSASSPPSGERPSRCWHDGEPLDGTRSSSAALRPGRGRRRRRRRGRRWLPDQADRRPRTPACTRASTCRAVDQPAAHEVARRRHGATGATRRRRRRGGPGRPSSSARTTSLNLVVADLLWLDGQSLLDVPLLERKRLLESVLPGDRAGPRPASTSARRSRRGSGRGGRRASVASTFKAANSRYRPGETAPDWTTSRCPAAEPARRCAPARRRGRAGWYGGLDARNRPDAGHPGPDRPPRQGRHHGRHPELQERGDDRLRGARRAGRPRPVLPGPAARRRQLRRRLARTAPAASSSRPSRPTTSSRSCSSGRATSSSGSA